MTDVLRLFVSLAAGLLLAAVNAQPGTALGFEEFGPAGEHIGRSPDWPQGVEDLLRHASRVYWYDVNGSSVSYYDGDVATVNELLDLYGRIELAKHPVVIRPGRPSAKSFEDKLTPYVVEFELPSGIALFHFQQYAKTGLYPAGPRLVVHLDAKLAERLDELKIPKNVTLLETGVRNEDALAHVDSEDAGLRYRAIVALGEMGISSGPSLKALLRASQDDNESIRAAGVRALEQVTAAQEPPEAALRQRLADFVRNHPQRALTLGPEELLAALRKVDAEYARGFTARGTLVEPALSGPGKLVAWTLTMGDDRLVLEQRDVEDADHPPAPGRFEDTIYSGPQRMGSLHGNRLWVDGKLVEAKPHASFEPVGSTYDLLIGRVLWPLGRGFSRRIDRITAVKTSADGTLAVAAESGDANLPLRWEMQIDPQADYLVRSAKAFRGDEAEPTMVVDGAGVLTGGGRSVLHTARWIEGPAGQPVSMAVRIVLGAPDAELIRRTEERLDEAREQGQ